jgi:hypothetical protein
MNTEEANLREILADHAARYPRLEAQDLYKLIYQAAMGNEHAVSSAVQVRDWLEREVAALGEEPDRSLSDPTIDPISPDGRIVRVHLRPYIAAGEDLAGLLEAFVRTAEMYAGTEERLRRYWAVVERMAEVGGLSVGSDRVREFFAQMEAQGLPAAYHSAAYRDAYWPAYRVVLRELLTTPS